MLIVAESASARFGGEAALPLHYFRVLRKRGVPVWLISHARTRDELSALFPGDASIRYVEDSRLNRAMWAIGRRMPPRISHFTAGFVSRLATQLAQRRIARRLVAEERIDVVHQPMPVSPREPSMMFGLGAPVVIGPMNGGMDYPPGFGRQGGRAERIVVSAGRALSTLINILMPGKRQAALLLVANQRTREALPAGVCREVEQLVENGVDLALWRPSDGASVVAPSPPAAPTRFIYIGRLVDWKGVDLLLRAFAQAASREPMRLLVVGDGAERRPLELLATSLGVSGAASFIGWASQEACASHLRDSDVLVLPSLLECGGAVVLEAMAMAKPVIATAWGGPLDYLDEDCGIVVAPDSAEALVTGFAQAMVVLAKSAEKRLAMGRNGRRKAEQDFDWDAKASRIVELYLRATATHLQARTQ